MLLYIIFTLVNLYPALPLQIKTACSNTKHHRVSQDHKAMHKGTWAVRIYIFGVNIPVKILTDKPLLGSRFEDSEPPDHFDLHYWGGRGAGYKFTSSQGNAVCSVYNM